MSTLKELYDSSIKLLEKNDTSDTDILTKLVTNYSGDDWKQHIIKIQSNCSDCNKKLIFSSELLDMYVVTWPPKSASKIHDHPNNGCIMRVLDGELVEDEFANVCESPIYVKTNIMKHNEKNIGYKRGNEMLHKISNNTDQFCVSLHLYSKGGFKMCIY